MFAVILLGLVAVAHALPRYDSYYEPRTPELVPFSSHRDRRSVRPEKVLEEAIDLHHKGYNYEVNAHKDKRVLGGPDPDYYIKATFRF